MKNLLKTTNIILVLYLLLSSLLISGIDAAKKSKKITKKKTFTVKTTKNTKSSVTAKTKDRFGIYEGWIKCGMENDTCTFQGKKMIKYGANDSWIYKEAEGSHPCKYTLFGYDPAPGVYKACYYRSFDYKWVECGMENDNCSFSGMTIVRYGADTRFNYKKASDGQSCKYTLMGGDPAPGVYKHCYYLETIKEVGWTKCGQENQNCTFSGKRMIRYGVEGKWLYKEAVNSQICSYTNFGGDPAPGVYKDCYYRKSTHEWSVCGKEGENCRIEEGMNFARFGAGNRWNYISDPEEVKCSIESFGSDPAPLENKLCYTMIEDPWVECGMENDTCRFSGHRLIRYGLNGKYYYREADDSYPCQYTKFGGDPVPGVAKKCYYRNRKHLWMFCANEAGQCQDNDENVFKYGVDSRWAYGIGKSFSCDYRVHGDVAPGVHKHCFRLINDPWTKCGVENEKCHFKGTRLVKYGKEGTFMYNEQKDGISCDYKTFGKDPLPGVYKECYVRSGTHFWVHCGRENDTCTLPGWSVVRYGAEGKFLYRYEHTSVACKYTDWGGDPAPGVHKKCEYAAYNLSEMPNSLKELSNSIVNHGIDLVEAANEASCSQDSGFGIKGRCLSSLFGEAIDESPMPPKVKEVINFLYGILHGLAFPFDFCLGDYTGETLQSDSALADNKCDTIPLMTEFNYGTIAGNVGNVACGATPVDIAFCANFDRCGTIALSINAGIAQCAATYSTGIAAILSPLSDVLDFMGIGFSLKRRFTNEFDIAYLNGNSVEVKTINTFGHFYMKVGLAFPLNDIKIAGKTLDDIFSFSLTGTYLLDFGNSLSQVTNIIESVVNANKNTGDAVVHAILNTNMEMTISVEGGFDIALSGLSYGFLPDLSFNIGTANFLITNGNGGASGMNRGVYFYLSRGINNIADIWNAIVEQFSDIFSLFGISVPKINLTMTNALGIFINDQALGFSFECPFFSLKCAYIYNKKSGSCDFNNQFFTAIKEAAKWIIKHARQLFDAAGAVVLNVAEDIGGFAIGATKEVAKFFANDVRNFIERDVSKVLSNVGNEIGNIITNDVAGVITDLGKGAVSVMEDTGKAIGSAAQDVGSAIEGVANDVGSAFGSAANDVGGAIVSVFSGWSKNRSPSAFSKLQLAANNKNKKTKVKNN